jgi:hypothetical protein
MTTSITLQWKTSKPLMYCLFLVLFSLTLRISYAYVVLEQFSGISAVDQNSYQIGYLTPDTPGYTEPALSLTTGDFARAISLVRPIGYPAFLALFGVNFTYVLCAQALVLSIIPVCTFFLVSVPTENDLLGFGAGLVSVLSPTGIAVGSLVASDALFASLFAVLFTALVYGTLRNSLRWILFSAIVSGLAILVRPILSFWPVVSLMVSALIAVFQDGLRNGLRTWFQRCKERLTQILALFFIPVVFMISFAEANYVENGIFTVSLIGQMTLREYLAVETEEWGKAGHWPTLAAIQQNRKILRERLAAMPIQEQVSTYVPESIAIFEKYPAEAIISFLKNAIGNAVGGWTLFAEQLPFSRQKLGSVLSVISGLESCLRWIGLLLILSAPLIGLVAVRVNPSPYERRLVSIIFAMTLTFIFYFMLLGLTFWTGPRIIYPVEIMEISTAALLVAVLKRAFGALPGRRWVGFKVQRTADRN